MQARASRSVPSRRFPEGAAAPVDAQPIRAVERYSRVIGQTLSNRLRRAPTWRTQMAKNLILWMLGVPISVLVLLNIFGYL